MAFKLKNTTPVSFDILSGLGQEIHAPLQSLVKSSSKLITDYKARDFEYIAYKDFKMIMSTLELMNRQLERCVQTTERMMDLHQIKHKTPSDRCDLNKVIEAALGLLKQQLKNLNIEAILRLTKTLPTVAIGNVECHQVIYNILLNAIQAMPAGGKIKIRTMFNKVDK